MIYKIIPTPQFSKSVKSLFKKYKLIANDLKNLEKELTANPKAGIELGNNCYKLRVQNSSVPTGKSGGFRVIYYLKVEDRIFLLEIYSKSDLENISDDKILNILKANGLIG
jgi:mRNA-degrading endonuclease RelE of RelBE toxin-antitoxin system